MLRIVCGTIVQEYSGPIHFGNIIHLSGALAARYRYLLYNDAQFELLEQQLGSVGTGSSISCVAGVNEEVHYVCAGWHLSGWKQTSKNTAFFEREGVEI